MEFALRRRFNPAARRFLLCSVKFAPLRNGKIYGAIWRRGEICSAARLFCGLGLRRPIKFKLRARLNFKCVAKFEAGDRSNFRRCGWILKFTDKILKREISLRKILSAIVSRL